MKIGLIQTRGIGDIVIAAPIAQHFVAQGHEVFWPVDLRFLAFVQTAFPEIRFLGVDPDVTGNATAAYFYANPLQQLQQAGCGQIHLLYSQLTGFAASHPHLAHALKFDEYKYAVCAVGFARKWALQLRRDTLAESRLAERLGIEREYVVVHEQGSDFRLQIDLPQDVKDRYQVVKIEPLTANPFDWLGVLERAQMFVGVDSCFSNLVEQLDLCPQKYLFLRSGVHSTPVLKNNWQFR